MYTPYYPQNFMNPQYQPPQMPQIQSPAPQPSPQPQSASMIWVQGEAGAKSYQIAPGTSVLLMDSESDRFYIKSCDNAGMPMPLRKFSYSEIPEEAQRPAQAVFPHEDYVTRKEFQSLAERIDALTAPTKPRKRRGDDDDAE